jgi:xanthine dehydrogenase accessory factor
MLENLKADGVAEEKLRGIKCPAGIDMPARTFPEVALAIIAEIVTLRRSREKQSPDAQVSAAPVLAEDPVCHMKVDPKTAAGSSELAGIIYYFCNVHCKKMFDKDPQKYLSSDARA